MCSVAVCRSFKVSELRFRAPIPRTMRSRPVGRKLFFVITEAARGVTFWIGARGEKTEREIGLVRVGVEGGECGGEDTISARDSPVSIKKGTRDLGIKWGKRLIIIREKVNIISG